MAAIGSIIALSLGLLGADGHLGAPIPHGSTPLKEPGRYESSRTYDSTLEFYRTHFRNRGGIRWRNIINLAHIRGKHIQSTRRNTDWAGINVYEKGGKVRIFVVPRDSSS